MNRKSLIVLVTEFLFAGFFAFGISGYMGLVLGICISLLLFFIFFFLWKKEILPLPEGKPATELINTLIVSAAVSVVLVFLMGLQVSGVLTGQKVLLGVSSFLFLFLPFLSLNLLRNKKTKKTEITSKQSLALSVSFLIPGIILLYFLPGELYLNNTDEFAFSFLDMAGSVSVFLPFVILAVFLASFLPEKMKSIVILLMNALTVCIYVQYMFFNKYVKELSGGAYDPKEHMLYTVINVLVWVAILLFFIILPIIKRKMKSVLFFLTCGVFALLLCSFLFLLVKVPAADLKREQYYLSGEEQFTVGKEENVIIFVLDGVDNSFVHEILEKNPEVFDEYKDFTLYTDTCSVYDFSCPSILQFLYGYTYSEGTDRSLPFQERFKDAGYRFIPFNEYAVKNPENIDNYIPAEASAIRIRYNEIRRNMMILSGYQVVPCAIKGVFHSEKVNFSTCLEYLNAGDEIITDNKEFKENLHLEYNPYSDKCFIYQHIMGAHYPCDYVEESRYCIGIFEEYIKQLKQLGVYDNTAIILCADHGVHDDTADIPFPTAATPMFMVKRVGEKHDRMQIDTTPMYYVDFQPTILSAAGLFDENTDYEIFGKPIEDYVGVTSRERVWFDTGFGNQKTRKYTYTGDSSELERVVKEGIYEETDSYEFRYEKE